MSLRRTRPTANRVTIAEEAKNYGTDHIRLAVMSPALSAVSHIYSAREQDARMTQSMATRAPVLHATNKIANRMRRCCSETPSPSLHPRNSVQRINTFEYRALVTDIRNNPVRLSIKTGPVGQVKDCVGHETQCGA
jgi:hypothetical protein